MKKRYRKGLYFAPFILGLTLCGCGSFVPGEKDETSQVKWTESQTKEPVKTSTEQTELSTELEGDVKVPEELNDYLVKFAQAQYEDEFLSLAPVDGISYVVVGTGIAIYHSGIYCGYLTVWDFAEGVQDTFDYEEELWDEKFDLYVTANYANHEGRLQREASDSIPYGNRYVYHGFQSPFPYGDTEWLVTNGIFSAEDEANQEEFCYHCVMFGKEGEQYGFCLFLEDYLMDDTITAQLLDAIQFTEKSFTKKAYENRNLDERINSYELNTYYSDNGSEFFAEENAGKITYHITADGLDYRVPKGTVAMKEGSDAWTLYRYSRSGEMETGKITVHHLEDAAQSEEELLKNYLTSAYEPQCLKETEGGWIYTGTETEDLFSEEQKEVLNSRPDGAALADDTCTWKHVIVFTSDRKTVIEVRMECGSAEEHKFQE